jgi:hypothetical protein
MIEDSFCLLCVVLLDCSIINAFSEFSETSSASEIVVVFG